MAGRIIVILIAALLTASPARAVEVRDLAQQAVTKHEAGKHAEAIASLRQALYAAMDASPMQFQQAIFVSERARGYGMFKERPGNVFKAGEKLLVYVEPYGMGWKKEGDHFHLDVTADFELRTPNGKILTGQKDFGRFRTRSHHRNLEFYVNLTYRLKGLKPGKYIIGTTFRDNLTDKTGNFDLPFEIK